MNLFKLAVDLLNEIEKNMLIFVLAGGEKLRQWGI